MDSILAQLCLIHYLKELSSTTFYLNNFNVYDDTQMILDNNDSLVNNNPYNIFPPINYSFKSKPHSKTYKSNNINIYIKPFYLEEFSVIFKINSNISKSPLIYENMNELKENLVNKNLRVKFYLIFRNVVTISLE